MSNYTMHRAQDYGRRHTYESEDGRLFVEISVCEHDRSRKTDAANVWKRCGFVDRFMPTTLHVEAQFTDDEGRAWGRFNPYALSVPGRFEINFARLYEATPENERALVAEAAAMYRDGVRAYRADGWTPCEITPDCVAF